MVSCSALIVSTTIETLYKYTPPEQLAVVELDGQSSSKSFYNAAGRMSSMSIDGVVQAEYEYNSLGQQVVRRLTQVGEVIHSIHDASGNRIAEYDVDEVAGTSTLLREY